jgi:hypothetical protein
MAETFKYVQGDTGPQLRLTLTDEDTGTATDLTGATVKLHFKAAGEDTVLFSKTLYVNPAPAESVKGIAIVNWAVGELDQPAGAYKGEIEVVRASGVRETLYDLLKFKIREDFA